MQATSFAPLDRVIVKRSNGTFDSWIVLGSNGSRVVVGAEVPHPNGTAEATKVLSVARLARWQEKYADRPTATRAATEMQLEGACRFAEGRL